MIYVPASSCKSGDWTSSLLTLYSEGNDTTSMSTTFLSLNSGLLRIFADFSSSLLIGHVSHAQADICWFLPNRGSASKPQSQTGPPTLLSGPPLSTLSKQVPSRSRRADYLDAHQVLWDWGQERAPKSARPIGFLESSSRVDVACPSDGRRK